MEKYTIGIDYGTLSARAVLLELATGKVLATAEFSYPHGVMENTFLDGTPLGAGVALQHPQDYLDALQHTVSAVTAGVDTAQIAGVGLDFTACTMLPVREDGTPLCFLEEFKNEPQAYVKLWKHHGAQAEADEITALAQQTKQPWLAAYGGKVSSEWLFPKLYETLRKAPLVYQKTARFVEAGDWLVWQLTGQESHNSCMAGYKGLWNKKTGYPDNRFWAQLDPRLADVVGTKVANEVIASGTKAGALDAKGAALTGLPQGVAVAAPVIDAHAAMPTLGITGPGKLLLILGTSSCHILLHGQDVDIPGICGRVSDGVIPGYVAYEAGQAGVGDSFAWFMQNCVPEGYMQAAREAGQSIYAYLDQKAAALQVGQNRILALDWWNGNRTPYVDAALSGTIVGLTLQTRPEDIWRGLIESTAYGTKTIVELYEKYGIKTREIVAAGGIAQKNPLLMQIYADVLGKPISVSGSNQAGAKGSAIYAAVAGGHFADMTAAANALADGMCATYTPNLQNTQKYAPLYRAYLELSDYFAAKNNIMHQL